MYTRARLLEHESLKSPMADDLVRVLSADRSTYNNIYSDCIDSRYLRFELKLSKSANDVFKAEQV